MGFIFTIPATVTVRPIQLLLCGHNVLQTRKALPDKLTYYCNHAKYRVENIVLFPHPQNATDKQSTITLLRSGDCLTAMPF